MKIASIIALLWAGLLLGTSFLATPAKFLAPSLSLPMALEVGRVTFEMLAWVEFFSLGILSLSLISVPKAKQIVLPLLIIICLMAIQQLLILPELSLRTDAVIQGNNIAPSNLHLFYVATEFLKICFLVQFAVSVQASMSIITNLLSTR